MCPAGKGSTAGNFDCTNPTPIAPAPLTSTPLVIIEPPVVDPHGAQFVGFAEIEIMAATELSIHLTTDGKEPICQETATRQNVVKIVLTRLGTIDVKAVACRGGASSSLAIETYVITRGPVIKVGFTLVGDVSAFGCSETF